MIVDYTYLVTMMRFFIGFKLVETVMGVNGSPEEPTISLKFVNEHHVEIDVIIQECGVFVTEPFAVKEDLSVIDD